MLKARLRAFIRAFEIVKKWAHSAYGNHITVCEKLGDGHSSQFWPLPAWLQLSKRMKERKEDKERDRIKDHVRSELEVHLEYAGF